MALAAHINSTSLVILELATMLFSAFALSRVTKRLRLPNVTGYLLAGILIGPYGLKWIDASMAESMSFVTDIALSFIAFGVGKYFRREALQGCGARIAVITLLEALGAAAAISATMLLVFRLPLSFSLLLGSIGAATAPASTLMTIRQYKARGRFVDTVLQVVALDDAAALMAFSVCATVSQIAESAGVPDAASILLPIAYNIAAVALGVGMAFLLKWAAGRVTSRYNRLLLVIILLLTLAGLCAAVDISPLLACMALGTVHANISKKGEALFKTVDRFSPPVLTFFFVLSGLRLDVPALATAGIIGVTYFFVRILGKYAGAAAGAALTHDDPAVRRYLGLALTPQAGVSIGLAALGQRMLSPELGNLLSTIVVSSAVLYELVGPALAKLSLHLAGALQPAAQTASGGDRADGAAGDVPSDAALNAAPAGADKARP
ncbi:MAG TPA: cation:proton antiporter [Candidatus Pullichristensenella avicola]|nr:cation:proton antiporter [Candidatus Pullichristensenella avicola]